MQRVMKNEELSEIPHNCAVDDIITQTDAFGRKAEQSQLSRVETCEVTNRRTCMVPMVQNV